jgi:protein TonB
MIASGKQEAETVLGTIAVAAHALSGATGAAIAMPRNGVVLCVGRSGEIAPQLGVALNLDSGISGECLRSGRSLRCDDATRDYQVDSEVCRELGLQSIAVIPLRGRLGRVGVLEAFSTRSYAFTDEHMDVLGRLAGLAEAAWARGSETDGPLTRDFVAEDLIAHDLPAARDIPSQDHFSQPSVGHVPLHQDLAAPYPVALRNSEGELADEPQSVSEPFAEIPRLAAGPVTPARLQQALPAGLGVKMGVESRLERSGLYLSRFTGWIVALSAVLLLSVVIWKAWYKASLPSPSAGLAVSPEGAPAESASVAAGAGLTWPPGAQRKQVLPNRRPTRAPKATKANPTSDAAIRLRESPQTITLSEVVGSPSNSTPGAGDVPAITPPADRPADLTSALSTTPSLPKLSAPVSQGIAGGVLVRKVQPAYPPDARRARVQGTVVLEATVTERGEIEGLKVISGPQVLAAAALDAVSKWRYTPYLLNGRPVKKQTRINISFIAP